jgi:hypothetical protein
MSSVVTKALKELHSCEGTYQNINRYDLIRMWCHPNPHFGGEMGHRYDGGSQECKYCLRPRNWTHSREVKGASNE